MTFEQLEKAIDFLRANGVAHYKGVCPNEHGVEDSEIELLLVEKPVKPEAPEGPAKENPLGAVPRGQDGLTAEEQLDTYGAVIDAGRDGK